MAISQVVEMGGTGDCREVVVVFPLSQHSLKLKLFAKKEGWNRKDEIFRKDMAPWYVKWASRFNYRVHSRKAHIIRDCEKDGAFTRGEIDVVELIPQRGETVYRCIATLPNAAYENVTVKIYNDRFSDTDIVPIVMGVTVVPKGMSSPVERLAFTFSLVLPETGIDYSVSLLKNGSLETFETISKHRHASLLSSHKKAVETALESPTYPLWYDNNSPTATELVAQSRISFEFSPLISIIVPLYDTDINSFSEMLGSVMTQSYANWELVLVNSTPENVALSKAVSAAQASDERVKVLPLEENMGIALNTNAGIAACSGEFVAFLDHDDIISPNALYEYVFALNRDSSIDVFYSDSDNIDEHGKHCNPYFKPSFSPLLMRQINYMCHFRMVRKSLLDGIVLGGREFDGAQDHDMLLKCLELTDKVHHCSKVLYSWRLSPQSTAATPDNKPYANIAARLAVEGHLKRLGIDADVENSEDACRFYVHYAVDNNPKVSILIPSKDNVPILNACIDSILEKSTYRNFEIIIIENNSENKGTFENYERLKTLDPRINVTKWPGEFNFSAINNFGVKHADGEYLLLLNNDTEVIAPDWLEEMLGVCQQSGVGAVGAKLFYPDRTIQHGGVYVQGEAAGHININLPETAPGYFNTARTMREVSAVTAACLMCPRHVFDEVGGFDESFRVAFNDVDFCMKIRKAGYSVVFNPASQLFHYESISRGYENTEAKILRFNEEASLLRYKWFEQYVLGDPYMNVNLDNNNAYFDLPKPCK